LIFITGGLKTGPLFFWSIIRNGHFLVFHFVNDARIVGIHSSAIDILGDGIDYEPHNSQVKVKGKDL